MTSSTLALPTTRTRSLTPARSTARNRSTTSSLRLTRRGRVVVVLAVLLAAFGAFTMRGAPAASTDVVHHPRTASVVVSPGETVWDIARRVAPQADVRSIVDEIERLNSLPDAGAIRIGQPLFVPAA